MHGSNSTFVVHGDIGLRLKIYMYIQYNKMYAKLLISTIFPILFHTLWNFARIEIKLRYIIHAVVGVYCISVKKSGN